MDVEPYLEPRPAPRWLLERARQHPDRTRFFVGADGEWTPVTWGEHAMVVRSVAAELLSAPRTGERAAIFAANSVEWAAAALAAEAAGMTVVPIYPASTAEQAAYVIEHSDARVLFVAGADPVSRVLELWSAYARVELIVSLDDTPPTMLAGGPTPEQIDGRFVHWSRLIEDGKRWLASDPDLVDRAVAELDMEAPAIMLYTSGTTGRPKGVPLSHRNLGVNTSDWLRCNAKLLHEDAVDLLWLPMSHIFGFGEVCLGNILGFTSYMATPKTVLDLMPRVRPTVFLSVPAFWEKLAAPALAAPALPANNAQAAFDATTGGRLKYCLSGGAGLKREVKEVFLRCGTLIIEGYGLTETSPTLTINRPDDFRFDSVGKPVPSVELRLADDGEILARGRSVFSGYHNDPEATAAAFTDDGWFRTGDIGRLTDDGFLQIVDRKKEILVTAGGKNVPPANIEREFTTEPSIAHAVVYGDGKKYLVAGLWLEPEVSESDYERVAAEAVERVNAKLARFEQIKRFRVMGAPLTVEGGLLTATLKLKRKRVYEAFRAQFEELYG